MSEQPQPPAPDLLPPTVIVRLLPNGHPQVSHNIEGPMGKLLANWLLDHGKLALLTQSSDQERSSLVKLNGRSVEGFLKKMGR